jgi:anti-sigma regulatory factor (Ser/Thr protein kinase)
MADSTLIQLPKATSAPATARRIVDGLDRLRPEVAINARLLVSELVANAVRHVRRDGEIGIHVAVDNDSLHVEVVDPGAGFEPRARTPQSPLGSGWGLHLVATLSDRWGVDASGPTRVWFEIDGATAP